MPFDPIANDRRELANLQIETPVIARREAQRVFVGARLHAAVTRIEATVHAPLSEDINVRAELRIQEQGEARVEQFVVVGIDESRRGLGEPITFEIHQSAESCAHLVVERGEGQRVIHPIQKIFRVKPDRCQRHEPATNDLELLHAR